MAQCTSENISKGFRMDEELGITNCMYKENGLEAVTFTTVYEEDDVRTDTSKGQFKPEMCHQIFGESESIYGYRNLRIDLKYLHNSCKCYVKIEYAQKIKETNIVSADNIMEKLRDWLPEHYTTDEKEFLELLANEDHKLMYGEIIDEFKDQKEMDRFPNKNCVADYKITLCELTEDFKEFHRRFETYIIWFIDAANYIDLDDNRWLLFYVYEEFVHPEYKTIYRSPIGYCSVYKFFNFPSSYRARISQFFILPTHQKRGIGTKLYEAIMRTLTKTETIRDISAEKPTPIFQNLRTYCDALDVYRHLEKQNIIISEKTENQIKQLLVRKKFSVCQRQRLLDILNCVEEFKRRKSYECIYDGIKERYLSKIKRARGVKRTMQVSKTIVDEKFLEIKIAEAEEECDKYILEIEPVIKKLLKRLITTSC